MFRLTKAELTTKVAYGLVDAGVAGWLTWFRVSDTGSHVRAACWF
jgi:hypothetical protein